MNKNNNTAASSRVTRLLKMMSKMSQEIASDPDGQLFEELLARFHGSPAARTSASDGELIASLADETASPALYLAALVAMEAPR